MRSILPCLMMTGKIFHYIFLFGVDINSDFIKLFKHKINWEYLTTLVNLPEYILIQFKDIIPWETATLYQNLNIDTISKLADYITWNYLWLNKQFNTYELKYLVTTYPDKINWELLSNCQKLTKQFTTKYAPKYI